MAKRHIDRALVRLGLRGGVGVMAIILILVSFATWSVYQKERTAESEARAAVAEHDELGGRKATLQANLEALGTQRGVEAAIRERYPVVKSGEEVITIVDAKPVSATTTPPSVGIWGSVRSWLGW